MKVVALALAIAVAGAAAAEAPDRSLRPVARGQVVNGQVLPARALTPETFGVKREVERPTLKGLLTALRPKQRTRQVEEKVRRREAARRQGMVCGDPEIQGLHVGRVAGTLRGCGVVDAVRIRSVAGVGLSTHAVMDCGTARALKAWVKQAARPAIGTTGGGLKELRVAAHYSCRTRNNRKGAKISEHGKGRAIDIAGFRLHDGREITVLHGWRDRKSRKLLRALHKAACGPFGTVLGPNADRYHQDHFHFDTARYRSGAYCR